MGLFLSVRHVFSAYNAMLQCQVTGAATLCNSTAVAFYTTLLLAGEGPIIHFLTPDCALYGKLALGLPWLYSTRLYCSGLSNFRKKG